MGLFNDLLGSFGQMQNALGGPFGAPHPTVQQHYEQQMALLQQRKQMGTDSFANTWSGWTSTTSTSTGNTWSGNTIYMGGGGGSNPTPKKTVTLGSGKKSAVDWLSNEVAADCRRGRMALAV